MSLALLEGYLLPYDDIPLDNFTPRNILRVLLNWIHAFLPVSMAPGSIEVWGFAVAMVLGRMPLRRHAQPRRDYRNTRNLEYCLSIA